MANLMKIVRYGNKIIELDISGNQLTLLHGLIGKLVNLTNLDILAISYFL